MQIERLAIQPDHVHHFIQSNLYTLPTDIARLIKGRSFHDLRDEFPHLIKNAFPVDTLNVLQYGRTCEPGHHQQAHREPIKTVGKGDIMFIYEYKVDANKAQYRAMDEAVKLTQFIRNKCLALWMSERGISKNDLQSYCTHLAKEYPFANNLNSQARQAAANRAWSAISRFYDNCKQHKPGKKGYPRFQHNNRSVEYKTTGWKLEDDGKHITFTDGCSIGRIRLIGTRAIETFPLKQIKRVRLIKRADGYYCQFVVQAEQNRQHIPTGKEVGIDVGLKNFYTDSEGNTIDNPRYLRKTEKKLKRLHRRLSRTQKKGSNRQKARHRLAKGYLKVSRQREDFARKTANALITFHDLIAYEDLQIANMVKNHKLAKSISDASWGRFLSWVKYYGVLHTIPVIAVPPQWTSQNCSGCGTMVKKTLSTRTHMCPACGLVLDRDHNAAINILQKARDRTVGHTETDKHRACETLLDIQSLLIASDRDEQIG